MGRDNAKERYCVLACTCLLTFGSYYCFDMPGVLENQITHSVIEPFAPGQGSTYYNLFYTVYAWTNMVVSLFAGLLVDKYGVVPSVFLFLSFCLVGQAVWSLGADLESTTAASRFAIMFGGRFIFGMGGGSITIAQNAITAYWFSGRELAMAFGITLSVSRLGSVLNFNLTTAIFDAFVGMYTERNTIKNQAYLLCAPNSDTNKWPVGIIPDDNDLVVCRKALSSTFWIGGGLIALSFISALIWRAAHNQEQREEGQKLLDAKTMLPGDVLLMEPRVSTVQAGKPSRKKMKISDIKELPISFWLCGLIIMTFYEIIFPFMAIAKDLLADGINGEGNYGLTSQEAGSVTSIVYIMSMVFSPFLGRAVDYFGNRTILGIFGCFLGVPAFALLAYTSISPIVSMLLLGASYCVCAAVLWPSIQFLVDRKIVGTANGLATSMQMLGIGICNIVTGRLMDANTKNKIVDYYPTLLFFAFMSIVATIFAFVLMCVDKTNGNKLHGGQRNSSRSSDRDPLLPSSADAVDSPGMNYLTSPQGAVSTSHAKQWSGRN